MLKDAPAKQTGNLPQTLTETLPMVNPFLTMQPFLSFTHTSTVITATGDHASINSRTTKLENGKLSTETFEGVLPRQSFDDAIAKTTNLFQQQSELLMKAFQLPFIGLLGKPPQTDE